MKVQTMNGWKLAPHCWKTYLANPIWFDRTPAWVSVSLFGFVLYFR